MLCQLGCFLDLNPFIQVSLSAGDTPLRPVAKFDVHAVKVNRSVEITEAHDLDWLDFEAVPVAAVLEPDRLYYDKTDVFRLL